MNGFISSSLGEYRRNLYRINMVAWTIILGIMLYLANSMVIESKKIPTITESFKKIQQKNFENLKSYLAYQIKGIDILFIMPNTGILSNDTTIPDDLSAKIDYFDRIQLFNNFKGRDVASQGKGIQPTIAIIIKLLISLLALWNGFEILAKIGYSRFLASMWTRVKGFFYTTVPRFLFFILTFLLVMGTVFLYIVIRGVTFSPGELSCIAGFLLEAVFFLGLFFFVGVLIGIVRKMKLAIPLIFISWLLINIANYWFVKPTVEPGFPDALKDYQLAFDKLREFINFEETAEKKYGKFDRNNLEAAKRVIEDFWTNWYLKKIVPLEKKLRDLIAKSIEKDCSISKFFPGLFFSMTANEVSGRGYINYLRYYDYLIEMQTRFARFIIDRAYYNDPKVMVNFIKGDEDIFYGKSALPTNYWSGLSIQFLYFLIAIAASFVVYMTQGFPGTKNPEAFDKMTLNFKSGVNTTVWDSTNDDILRTQLVNTFFGKKGKLPLKLTLDGKPFPTGKKPGFLFVPKPGDIPGELKGKHLVRFIKRVFKIPSQDIAQLEKEIGKGTLNKHFIKMKKEEQVKLLLSLFFLVKSPIYLFDNFAEGISETLSIKMCTLVDEKLPSGSMIIDLNATGRQWNNQTKWCAVHLRENEGKYEVTER